MRRLVLGHPDLQFAKVLHNCGQHEHLSAYVASRCLVPPENRAKNFEKLRAKIYSKFRYNWRKLRRSCAHVLRLWRADLAGFSPAKNIQWKTSGFCLLAHFWLWSRWIRFYINLIFSNIWNCRITCFLMDSYASLNWCLAYSGLDSVAST